MVRNTSAIIVGGALFGVSAAMLGASTVVAAIIALLSALSFFALGAER